MADRHHIPAAGGTEHRTKKDDVQLFLWEKPAGSDEEKRGRFFERPDSPSGA